MKRKSRETETREARSERENELTIAAKTCGKLAYGMQIADWRNEEPSRGAEGCSEERKKKLTFRLALCSLLIMDQWHRSYVNRCFDQRRASFLLPLHFLII